MIFRAGLRAVVTAAGLLATSQTLQAADLIDIYEMAVERDSVLQATIAQYEAAKQALPVARSARLPNVTLVATEALSDTNDDQRGIDGSSSYGVSLTQAIYDKGSNLEVDKAKIAVAQAEATLREARHALLYRTAQAYFNILTADEAYRAATSSRKAIARQTEQAERRFEVGLTAITDVKEAQAQLDLARANEVVAGNRVALSKEALRVIIDQEVPELSKLSEDAVLNSPTPPELDKWLEIARENSPALERARLDYDLARMDLGIERAARLPQLNLVGQYQNSSEDNPRLLDAERGTLTLQLSMPLYTGGRNSALIQQAKQRSQQASFNYDTVRRSVEQDTRDAYLSVIADISQAKALKQALQSTEVAKEATQAGFDAGTRTAVEVLVSLRDTFSAYADYAAARHQFVLRSLRLRQAAGILSEDHLLAVNRSLE